MVDLHSHIVPGVDDGVRSLDDAVRLAEAAGAEGVRAIAATPHVRDDYPTTPEQMEDGVAQVRRRLAEAGVSVEVLHGGEVAIDRIAATSRDDLLRFSLAQTGRYLLVEFPYYGWPLALDGMIRTLGAIGLAAVLAHPERNADVQARPARLEAAVEAGALVQVTAASLDGRLGGSARRTAKDLLKLRLVHVLASDAHGPEIREAGLAAAARSVGDDRLAAFLTTDAPAAVAAGEPVPPRPAVRQRRFFVF